MEIRQNSLMYFYLEKLTYDFQKFNFELPVELNEIVEDNLLMSNECVTLKILSDKCPKFESDIEKCEWEYNETHFHPDEYAKNGTKEIVYLSYALECSKKLAYSLKQEFPKLNFRILVTFSETRKSINGKIETYGSSSIRFHQIREKCENIMRTSNLDDFDTDAVLEIDV